jgi:hypothetical protein
MSTSAQQKIAEEIIDRGRAERSEGSLSVSLNDVVPSATKDRSARPPGDVVLRAAKDR